MAYHLTAEQIARLRPMFPNLKTDTDVETYIAGECRYCEHLVTVSRRRQKWIGACEFRADASICGRWQLSSFFQNWDIHGAKETVSA